VRAFRAFIWAYELATERW